MRVCIYGAGAMGTSLGIRLFEVGRECDFVTRNEAHVLSLRSKGYPAFLPSEMSGEYDLILLATKQRENSDIARFLLPYQNDDGALLTVQNGLPEEGLAEVFGSDRVYGCTLGWGAELTENGEVRLTSKGELHLSLGAYGEGKRLKEIEEYLSPAFSVTVGNLTEIRFSKLAVNASFSTLSAVSSLTFGELASRRRALVLSLMRETVNVAKACGCKRLEQNGHDISRFVFSPLARLLLPAAMRKHRDIKSGMLKDLLLKRTCDVDFVAGAVIRMGMKKGVQTPMLIRAVDLVHDIERGNLTPCPENLKLLYK